ncbi:protein arginine N-methyltransferase 6 isoform X2 [Prorops nasuta]|uniref:protein arginine N-methyltransferase 6 isoform X2 n=1 Tax=Prorops nasuta TaxID=863751 RepID=UPI0034CD85EF
MDQYFESYEELNVHQLMLSDKPRNLAYKNAIFHCKHLFKDKIVMDVGSGTGILSVFCAQAGARLVYAVEASNIVEIAKNVIEENELTEKIKIIRSKVEEIDPDSIEKVDIIISEWMGFYLLHEGMLDSVIFARDTFLKPDGLLFPHKAKLYAVPCELPSMFSFWDDIHGVSMKCVGKEYRKAKSLKPEILSLDKESLLADEVELSELDLKTISVPEISKLGGDDYFFVCDKNGRFQGVCMWFTVVFPDGTQLCTKPGYEVTHWQQTVIILPEDLEVEDGQCIAFKLELIKDESKPRAYKIELDILDADEMQHKVPCDCHMTKCIAIRQFLSDTMLKCE